MGTVRKRVYIAGPISKGDLLHNINQGTAAFIALAKAGFSPWCPMWSVYSKPAERTVDIEECPMCLIHGSESLTCKKCKPIVTVTCEATAMGNDEMQHSDWMGVDLPWVAVSDAVLRLPGESTGADMEVAHAESFGIPVVTVAVGDGPEPIAAAVEYLRQHFSS